MQSKPQEESNDGVQINLNELPRPELTGHAWIQQGTALTCRSCPFAHVSYIPPDFQLYGINEKGEPMVRKIVVKP